MLHVREFGPAQGRPVLALHGLQGNGRRFEELAGRLGRRLICPDLRGHGHSTGMPPWSLDQHAEDVLALIGEPMDVIGYSFGGAIAVHAAAQQPDRFGKLILLDPAIALAPEFVEPKARFMLREEETYTSPAEAIKAILTFRPNQTEADAAAEVAEELTQHGDGLWRWRMNQLAVIVAFSEACRKLAPPTHPTLLVCTSGNPEGTRAFAETCNGRSNIRIETLDCGHRLLIERPTETAALAAGFLTA